MLARLTYACAPAGIFTSLMLGLDKVLCPLVECQRVDAVGSLYGDIVRMAECPEEGWKQVSEP